MGLALDALVSGVFAEAVSKVCLHPVDTIKARLQYHVRPTGLPFWSDFSAALQMLRQDVTPLRSLYRGLSPALLGVLPVSAVYMPTYESAKDAFRGTPLQHTPAAAVLTGAAAAVVRVPVSVLKSRMQLQLHSSLSDAVRSAVSQRAGLRGLYVGLNATLILDVTYAAVQFTALEQLRRAALLALPRNSTERDLSAPVNAAIGFATGTIAASVTEPIDVVRTRLMAQRTASGSGPAEGVYFGYRGLLHGLWRAASADGVHSLWRGILPRLLIKGFGSSLWYSAYMFSQTDVLPCLRPAAR